MIFDRSVFEIPKWRVCVEGDKMDVSIMVTVQDVSPPPASHPATNDGQTHAIMVNMVATDSFLFCLSKEK